MKKTTFTEKFDKAVRFYDHTYHIQKATYKGLNAVYKKYSQTSRSYADSLISLAKDVYSQLPQLNKQDPAVISMMKQIVGCIQASSQLYFNYADRLMQVSSAYNSQYATCKKKKDNQMKIIKDRNEEDYNSLRQKELNRNILNNKEKDICKVLHNNLDKLAEDENERIHKIKQQTIIHFSFNKKVSEKQFELLSELSTKLIKQQLQVKNTKIAQISEELRNLYNQYGGDQIDRKSYDLSTSRNPIFRESVRASMIIKERASKLSENQNKFKQLIEKYDTCPDSLLLMTQNDYIQGFFDNNVFSKDERRRYARQIDGQIVRNIAYDMIEGYGRVGTLDSDGLTLLQLIKASLKVKGKDVGFKCKNANEYFGQVEQLIHDDSYIYHVKVLQEISTITTQNFSTLNDIITHKHRNVKQSVSKQQNLNFTVKSCIIDLLLDSVCVTRPNQPVLTQGYLDYLHLICKFGQNFLGFDRLFTALLLLRKVDRLVNIKCTDEQLENLLNDQYLLEKRNRSVSQIEINAQQTWSSLILNNNTNNLLKFYSNSSSFLTSFKMLLAIDKLGLSPISKFNAHNHFYMCIRCAGYNYLKDTEQSWKMLDHQLASPQERLKNVVEGIQKLDYEGIIITYLQPGAHEIGKCLGVGQKKVSSKLLDEFTYPVHDLINANLEFLSQQEGVDRDGYILRLGIILAQLDIENPQPIPQYDTFFKVLQRYLQSTQKQYDNILEHSRKTELWIVQDNAQATPNCIDFCSLLYKPFEYLLISLKELQKAKITEYTKKYSQFIKLRLNTDLKTQIIKYINFLFDSLSGYKNSPHELALKPKRLEKVHMVTNDQCEKQKNLFKQLTRRLYNLLFLKQELDQIVCDFLDTETYKSMDNSIFNVYKLNKTASQSQQYKEILTNIKDIVEAVLASEEKIVKKIANITVFSCQSKLFENLYFQNEKNTIQQFFSNAADYKLSQLTFLKYQQHMQSWFMIISKNIPDYFIDLFEKEYSKSFYLATEAQILNSTKFKLPLKPANVIPYLDSDVNFVTTMMKQKFFKEETIVKEIKTPFGRLLSDMRSETSKLIGAFETATLKNDKNQCRYLIVLLNLRVKDEKAMEFVKKYKSITQN